MKKLFVIFIRTITVLITLFLLLLIYVYFAIGQFRIDVETFLIKKELKKSENIARVIEMRNTSDHRADYHIYIETKKGKKKMLGGVERNKDKKITVSYSADIDNIDDNYEKRLYTRYKSGEDELSKILESIDEE